MEEGETGRQGGLRGGARAVLGLKCRRDLERREEEESISTRSKSLETGREQEVVRKPFCLDRRGSKVGQKRWVGMPIDERWVCTTSGPGIL